nr:DHH family phosphoesterase [Erysipelotrichaceae bacterium]
DVIPKINAVSRMDDMLNVNYVVRYLLDNSFDCMAYLNKIEEINTLRKDLTKQMSALAQRIIDPERKIIIVSSSAFREGLCGLIANRLMNEYGKPVIVLAESDGILKGSGRAVRGSDLYAYLSQRKDLFLTFGGHAQAVGLSMEKKDLNELQRYIDENPFEYEEYEKDVLVLDPDMIDMDLLDALKSLEPFGTGFEEPLFALEDISYRQKFLVASRYPKFILNDRLEAISFHPAHQNRAFDTMLGHLKKDDYHKGKISFVIEDLI